MSQFSILAIFLLSLSCPSADQRLSSEGRNAARAVLYKKENIRQVSILYSEPVRTEAIFGPGNWPAYLQKNLNTDIAVRNECKPGTYSVRIDFILSKEGVVTKTKAVSSFGFGMEQEAIRVISTSPKWTPATQNGRAVSEYRCQDIMFQVCTAPAI